MAATVLYDSGKRAVFKDIGSAVATASSVLINASALLHAQFTVTLDAGSSTAIGLNAGDRLETAANAKAFKVLNINSATELIICIDKTNAGTTSAEPANADDFVFKNGTAVTAGTYQLHASTAVASPINALAHKLSISKLWWSVTNPTGDEQLVLDWEASSDLIFMRMHGTADWDFSEHGILLKNTGGTGVNGDINITTLGTGTITHSLIIECKKENNFGTSLMTNS